MKNLKRAAYILLAALIAVSLFSACGSKKDKGQLGKTADYLLKTVAEPTCSSVGGEWSVIGLARSGRDVDKKYYDGYYERLCETVKEKGGVLDGRKNTEYSRVILALTAIGRDPADVAGYNLLAPLADYDKTVLQGINGPIWALIALDSGNYDIPETENGTQAARESYVGAILEAQSSSGAWSLTEEGGDVDITAMAIQALAKYESVDGVSGAVDRALNWLSEQQRPNGGFNSYGAENSESIAQVIVALCELGIPLSDARFVKNERSLLDALTVFACEDGSFCHTLEDGSNLMATEQCMYALAAVSRAETGESSLYRMAK